MTTVSPARVLILGTAEWDSPIATNQHYMARELACDYEVTFVESMGLRRVEFRARDLRRIAGRLARKLGRRPRGGQPGTDAGRRPVPERVRLVSPAVIPHHRGLAARINRVLLRRQVAGWLTAGGPRVLWLYTPVAYGLEAPADAAVYHCVDLLAESPGKDRAAIDANERHLAGAGVRAIASSEVVAGHLAEQGFPGVAHWPNVADVDTILGVTSGSSPQEAGARRPRAVFAGNLSEAKVDFDLLEAVLDAGIGIDLAGPVSEGGGNSTARVDRLVGKGAIHHGTLSLDELAALYARCTVGLIPYALNSLTRGVNPLKTYEYLAAGLGVVSTPVPAVRAQAPDVVVAATAEEFVAAVEDFRGAALLPDAVARRQALARRHSWATRGREARALVAGLVAPPDLVDTGHRSG